MRFIVSYLLLSLVAAAFALLYFTSADRNQPECQGKSVPAICVQ